MDHPLSGREAVGMLTRISQDVRHFSGRDVSLVELPEYLQWCFMHTDWPAVAEEERAATARERMEGPRGR